MGISFTAKHRNDDKSIKDGYVFAQLRENIRNAGERKLTAANNATYKAAHKLLEASQELVPVYTETLKLSGEVLRGSRKAEWYVKYSATAEERFAAEIAQGKVPHPYKYPDFNYALIQHETEEYHHTTGQWHYLSDPIRDIGRRLCGDIKSAMRRTKAKSKRRLKDITEGEDFIE